jgi:hypothetical protein
MVTVVITLFVRGCYVNNQEFKEEANGILMNVKKGSRMSYFIYLYNSNTKTTNRYNYDINKGFEKLIIGDSIVKVKNSFFLKVYTKRNGIYLFKESFEIDHW